MRVHNLINIRRVFNTWWTRTDVANSTVHVSPANNYSITFNPSKHIRNAAEVRDIEICTFIRRYIASKYHIPAFEVDDNKTRHIDGDGLNVNQECWFYKAGYTATRVNIFDC